LVASVDQGAQFVHRLINPGALGSGLVVIGAGSVLGSHGFRLEGALSGAVCVSCGGDGHHRDCLDVLDDLSVASDGIVEDAEGFEVASQWQLMEASFPKEKDVLGVLGEASAEPAVNWSRMETHQQKTWHACPWLSFSQVRESSEDNSNATLRAKWNMRGLVGLSRCKMVHTYRDPKMPAMLAWGVMKDS